MQTKKKKMAAIFLISYETPIIVFFSDSVYNFKNFLFSVIVR